MTPTEQPAPTSVRPEIQALRAVAVTSVVAYHFWPAVAPAGFVGVDVFFVISGYLISALLLREVARTGRISLRQFYLRRSRRILPAAVAVLGVTALATIAFVPGAEARRFLGEVVASGLYFENWQQFANASQSGFAELASTPVQHFWSLSVEEQFYIVWPLVLIGGLWLSGRYGGGRRWPLVAVLGSVTAASFAHGVSLTMHDNNLAYFSTLSRAWEFGVGALLACAPVLAGAHLQRVRALVSWLGLAAIVVSIWTLSDVNAFPGMVVLLPVLGAAAVIWGGTPRLWWSNAGLARLGPVQWLGDVSYSLYLWHWPIILMTPFITGVPSEPWVMAVLLALSIAVAGLSKKFIEDPFRVRSPLALDAGGPVVGSRREARHRRSLQPERRGGPTSAAAVQ